MPTYNITAPDGKKLKITVPEGTDPDEVLRHVQENYQPDTSAATKKADFDAKVAAEEESMRQQFDPAASDTFTGDLANFAAGNTRGLKAWTGGVRQGYNALVGDDAKLAELNQDAADRNAQDAPLLDTGAGAAGDFVGKVAPTTALALLASRFGPAIPGLAAAAGTTGAALRGGAAMATGAGWGALGGATSELTPEQEAEGGRLQATESGAKWGAAAVPALGALKYGARQAGNMFRELPEEAMLRLARQMGYKGDPATAIAQLQEAMTTKLGGLREKAGSMYRAAEGGPELPPVSLKPTATALSQESADTIFAPLEQQLNPKLTRVTEALRRSAAPTEATLLQGNSTTAPAILGANGAPISAGSTVSMPAQASFSDMREAVRQLKAAARAERDPSKAAGYRQLVDNLDESLQSWAKKDPKSQEAYAAGQAVDQFYRERVLPFVRKNTAMGSMLNDGGELVPGAGERMLVPERALELDKLLTHVPEARAPMRAMVGRKILQKTGSTPAADALRNAPPSLLTAEERDLQARIVEALRRRTGEGRSIFPNIFQGTGALARWKNGVDPVMSDATRYLQRTFNPIAGYTIGRAEEE